MAALAGAAVLAGCAVTSGPRPPPPAQPREISLAPVASQERALDRARERDLVWPLWHERETDTERQLGLRPFFYHSSKKRELKTDTLFLWPIGRYSTRPGQGEVRITPFFSYKVRFGENALLDADYIVFPLIFIGTDEKDGKRTGRYFGFFPLGGEMRGLLGKEKIEFWLFPLYMRTYDEGYNGLHVLFPFFQDAEGKGKSSLAVLPFYAYKKKEGRYDRRSYLWPFGHVQWNMLDTPDPVKTVAVLPFYGQDISVSGKNEGRTFLWPFFSYRVHRGTGYSEYNLPWPFFRRLRSKDLDHDRIWPLYSRWENRKKGVTDWQYGWPFGWRSVKDVAAYKKESVWALPFYWDHDTRFKDEKKTKERYTKVWPLFHRLRDREGGIEHQFLSVWWFRDYQPWGFERSYDAYLTLYQYRERPSGDWRLSLAGPLFQLERVGDASRQRVLLFSRSRRGTGPEARSEWTFLEGFVRYTDDAGARSLGLFWVPELLRWGKPGPAPKAARTTPPGAGGERPPPAVPPRPLDGRR